MQNYIKELPEDAVQVSGTMNWVTPDGRVFGIETRKYTNKSSGTDIKRIHYGEYFQYRTTVNKHNGYVYCTIKYVQENGKTENRQRRLHIVVAETFLANPFRLPVVGHKNNIKSDNRASNLYWTTISENTQKAIDDGLLVNSKGYDDSQSYPVVMFDTCTNNELGRYGSASEAEKQTGISCGTILRQCRYKKPVRKPYYFRFQSDESVTPPRKVCRYEYKTDALIGTFYNTSDAAAKTGVPASTISCQCVSGEKPKYTPKSKTYFLYK